MILFSDIIMTLQSELSALFAFPLLTLYFQHENYGNQSWINVLTAFRIKTGLNELVMSLQGQNRRNTQHFQKIHNESIHGFMKGAYQHTLYTSSFICRFCTNMALCCRMKTVHFAMISVAHNGHKLVLAKFSSWRSIDTIYYYTISKSYRSIIMTLI